MLLIFGDGSVEASCALAYLRWELEDGSVVCRLLAGKTRVAARCKISIPRMELMGVCGGCQTVLENQGFSPVEPEQGEVLHGLLGGPWHDFQGLGDVP
jgi:hypothetical protein